MVSLAGCDRTRQTSLCCFPFLDWAFCCCRIARVLFVDALQAARVSGDESACGVIVDWCSQLEPSTRVGLRMEVLPHLSVHEKPLAVELVESVGGAEIAGLCEAIDVGPSGASPAASWMYAELFSGRPGTYAWARRRLTGYFSVFVFALDAPPTEESLQYVILQADRRVRSAAMAAFASRVIRDSVSVWLHHRLEEDAEVWSVMLADPNEEITINNVERLCERLRRSAIARRHEGARSFDALPASIQDHAILQYLLDWIELGTNDTTPATWLAEPWVEARLRRDSSRSARCLTARFDWTTESWLRAWTYTTAVPLTEEWAWQSIEITAHLTRTRPGQLGDACN